MRFPDRAQLDTQPREQVLDVTADLQPVLQRARGLESDTLRCLYTCAKCLDRWRDDLYGIACQAHDPFCLLRVSGVVAEQMRVVPHHRAATGSVHHDGLDPRG